MKRLILASALLLGACTMIDMSKPPPEDFPALAVSVHYVPNKEMHDRCDKYVSAFGVARACAEWDFDRMTCDIWFSAEYPPSESDIEHERLHCLGYDHIGESALRDDWEAHKRSNK